MSGIDAGYDGFVAGHADRALRLARLLTGNREDAEDLAQEAMARALTKWSAVSRADDRYAYFRTLLVNLHTGRSRRARLRTLPLHRAPEPVVALDGRPSGRAALEDRDALSRAVAALPARQRAVLVLRFYEDLDVAEVAQAMGLTPSSVRSAQARALASVRDSLDDAARETVDD